MTELLPVVQADDWAFEDEDDLEEDGGFDCHMGPDGQCGAAGSEQCEFECPTMRAWRRGDLP